MTPAKAPSAVETVTPSVLNSLAVIGGVVCTTMLNDPTLPTSLGISAGGLALVAYVCGCVKNYTNQNKAHNAPPPVAPRDDGTVPTEAGMYLTRALTSASLNGHTKLVTALNTVAETHAEELTGGK